MVKQIFIVLCTLLLLNGCNPFKQDNELKEKVEEQEPKSTFEGKTNNTNDSETILGETPKNNTVLEKKEDLNKETTNKTEEPLMDQENEIKLERQEISNNKDVKDIGTKTFLLIGIDSRGEVHSRSDAILLARYEPKRKTIKIASLMRDSYVKIKGHPHVYSKLNHAYYIGGKELLVETIEGNFGITIDHTATIDFNGFVEIIDLLALEGLEVELTKPMIEYLGLKVKPGTHVLKGEQLLSYVRFRDDRESDFGRVKRQQAVLVSLRQEMVHQLASIRGITKLPSIIRQSLEIVETDLSFDEILSLGTTVIFNPIEDIETIRIPISGSFENKRDTHSGAVLKLNFDENIEAINEFFGQE